MLLSSMGKKGLNFKSPPGGINMEANFEMAVCYGMSLRQPTKKREEGIREARQGQSSPNHGAQVLNAVPSRTVPRWCEVLGFSARPLRNHWVVSLESGPGCSSADAM